MAMEAIKALRVNRDTGFSFIDKHWNILKWDKLQAPFDFSKNRKKKLRDGRCSYQHRHGDGHVTGTVQIRTEEN